MAKQKARKPRTARQTENRKRVFLFLEKLVVGAVKLWFVHKGVPTPFIVAVDDADKITQDVIDSLE